MDLYCGDCLILSSLPVINGSLLREAKLRHKIYLAEWHRLWHTLPQRPQPQYFYMLRSRPST